MSELLSEVGFDKYVSRMAGVADKPDFLHWVGAAGSVLDFGCGDGVFAPYFSPASYTGLDASSLMRERASSLYPQHTFVEKVSDGALWDTVLFSSVLHEVYSYSGFDLGEVRRLLQTAAGWLTPGGRIVVRDGVCDVGNGLVRFALRDPVEASVFLDRLNVEAGRVLRVEVSDGCLRGCFSDVVEFLNVYTWGEVSFDREKFERVNFLSSQGWVSLFEDAGYRVSRLNVLSQDDYFTHLADLVDLGRVRWDTKVFVEAFVM